MERDIILSGVHIGEHRFDPDSILDEIKTRCIDRGHNFVTIRPKAGIEIPMLKLMCGHPEILVSSLRGTARATNAKRWGTYLAHEWYGGMRHEDILKRKRMSLAYKYAYLSGSQLFCLES